MTTAVPGDAPDNRLDSWVEEVSRALGLSTRVDRDLLLDLSKEAAHRVARPAAPLTTFLLGLAAGAAGGTPVDVAAAARVIAELLATHEPREQHHPDRP
ncbi:MAG: DUF6457 domain-containing protein [Actinomycetes bacterium]